MKIEFELMQNQLIHPKFTKEQDLFDGVYNIWNLYL